MADILDALESRDPATLTRGERAALVRRAEAREREERVRSAAKDELAARPSASRGVGGEPCPFPLTSPEGVDWLLSRTLARIQAIVQDPASTNRDVLDAGSLLRMAAGLGKADPVAEEYELDMDSMLGGADVSSTDPDDSAT